MLSSGIRFLSLLGLLSLSLSALPAQADTSSQNYTLSTLPKTWQDGQKGTNQCGEWTPSSDESKCQTMVGSIGKTERVEVAWFPMDGRGTRLIPNGAINGAQFLKTKTYVQVTGEADFTKMNIPDGDGGGELDPHGADGNGSPIGGLVFSNVWGEYRQIHEWTNFMAYSEFCIRACKPGPEAAQLCQHIYDEMGCSWNMPASYPSSSFEFCEGETDAPMGIYVLKNGSTSTFSQGQAKTPKAHKAPKSSQCEKAQTVSAGTASDQALPSRSSSSGVVATASPPLSSEPAPARRYEQARAHQHQHQQRHRQPHEYRSPELGAARPAKDWRFGP